MRLPRARLTVWFLTAIVAVLSVVFSYSVQAWGKSKSARDYRSKVVAFANLEKQCLESGARALSFADRVGRSLEKPAIKEAIKDAVSSELSGDKFRNAYERERLAEKICKDRFSEDYQLSVSGDYSRFAAFLMESVEFNKKAAFYAGLKQKYERALKRPWESLPPDPLWPLD